jgi:ribosomal protein S18 acetylase RimI-like enzyme
MTSIGPIPLSTSDLQVAANVLARSFADDPGLIFVLPDSKDRKRFGNTLALTMIRFVLRCGAPLSTPSPLRGVALWFPPDAAEPTSEDLVESGIALLPALIGSEAMARFKSLFDPLEKLHQQMAPDPHWYLAMLGVDPQHQRQGTGEALMQSVFDKADRDRVPCYLEAPTIENARYYGRRGFSVVAETDIPESDVHIWCMRRDYRAKN